MESFPGIVILGVEITEGARVNECKDPCVLIKFSGEVLCGKRGYGYCPEVLNRVVREVKTGYGNGAHPFIAVVGGGNIGRGEKYMGELDIDQPAADDMGMLATVINGIGLQNRFEKAEVETRLMTAIKMDGVAEHYIRRRAERHLSKGRVIILAAGIGTQFFTTDTTAAQRGIQLSAKTIYKGTGVEGVYSADPREDPNATLYTEIRASKVIELGLKILDLTAIALLLKNKKPCRVFNMHTPGNITRAIRGEAIGTLIIPD